MLTGRRRILGEDHPGTLIAMDSLGALKRVFISHYADTVVCEWGSSPQAVTLFRDVAGFCRSDKRCRGR